MAGGGIRKPGNYECANKAIAEAKNIIRFKEEDYKSAVTKVEEAIKLYPGIRNGQEMLTACEILHMSETFDPQPDQETWPYDLLKLPSSSTESKVKSQYRQLMDDLRTLKKYRFPGVSVAIKFLHDTMYLYNRKLNLDESSSSESSSDSNDDDDIKEEEKEQEEEQEEEEEEEEEKKCDIATSGDGTGGDNRDCEDLFAWSPVFKKLRKEIFTTLPQNPDFSPLSKYCTSVQEVMKEGFELVFVKLTQQIQNLGDTLSQEEEDNIREKLSNLEEMKYDVTKLRNRYDELVKLAKKDRDMKKELETHISEEMLQLGVMQSRISELEKEKGSSLKSEIAALKTKVDKHGDLGSMLADFKSIGMDIWK